MVYIKKLGQLLVIVLLVTFFTALLLELVPGDPVEHPRSRSPATSSAKTLRQEHNLDDPFFVRSANWLRDFVTGDMGNYYTSARSDPVADRLGELPGRLAAADALRAGRRAVVAIPLAVLDGVPAGHGFDKMSNTAAFGCSRSRASRSASSCSTTWA